MFVEDWLETIYPLNPSINRPWVAHFTKDSSPICNSSRKRQRQTPPQVKSQVMPADPDEMPKAKRHKTIQSPNPSSPSHFLPAPPSDDGSSLDDLQSHKSGRLSLTKQIRALADLPRPFRFRSLYGDSLVKMPQGVVNFREEMEQVSRGVGILAYSVRHRLANITEMMC